MNRRGRKQNVFVVKSTPKEIDEKHKELSTRRVYLLKDDDQAIHRYENAIYAFVDDRGGRFLVLSHDRAFYQNFRNSFYKELQVSHKRIRLLKDTGHGLEEIRILREHRKPPFLFVETAFQHQSTIPFIEEVKREFPDIFVVLLLNDAEEKKLAQFLEAGVDNFITKPVSLNLLMEKIANTLVPPERISRLARDGKRLVVRKDFSEAYTVAQEILEGKPGSPAGLMIMGDALKGMGKRKEAFALYTKAVENAPQYLDPRKKLVEFYQENGDTDAILEQLLGIDELSPLHIGRKHEIADIFYDKKEYAKAAEYYLDAVVLAHGFRNRDCVQMAEDFANKIFKAESGLSVDLLRVCAKLAGTYKADLHWSLYNRLGMLLLKQGRWREAVPAYAKAVDRSPDDVSLLLNMGMAYVEGKDFGSAAQKFERALALEPRCYRGNVRMAYTMGESFFHANRHGSAKRLLKYVHETSPGFGKTKALLKAIAPKGKK